MKAADATFRAKLSQLLKSVWTFPLVLAGLKLWLCSHLPVMASVAGHDNLRYVIMAANLLQPDAPYNQHALMRQSAYPAFIVLSYFLGISLKFSQELLYLAAGFFLAWSFLKYCRNHLATVLFLSLYILAPASFHWSRQTLQECLYLPLTVFIVACLIHLVNIKLDSPRFLKWSAILGAGLAVFWNTRPEGVAVLPSIALAYASAIARFCSLPVLRLRPYSIKLPPLKPLSYSIALTVLPIIILTNIFSLSAYIKYGIFLPSDLNSPGIKAAYASITSVSPDRWRYRVSVPKETRLEIYAASPTFQKLSGYLESEKGKVWRQASCDEAKICDDYASGWFFWALRDAVADAGQYKSAPATESFYRKIAGEVKAACQSGELKCKHRRFSLSSFAPDIRAEYVQPFASAIATLSANLISCSLNLNLGSGEEDVNFRKTYYEKITRESADFILQRQQPINQIKDKLTAGLCGVYKFLFPILAGSAVIGIGLAVTGWRKSAAAQSIPRAIAWILLSFIVIRVLLFAYIDATSYPIGTGCRYLRPVLPLMWLGMAIGVSYLAGKVSKRLNMVR